MKPYSGHSVSRRGSRLASALLISLVAVTACDQSELSSTFPQDGDGTSGSQDVRVPDVFEIVSGANQSAPAGELLPQPVTVRATDSGGKPFRNLDVDFVVISGGGSTQFASTQTNADGVASNRWTLGSTVGQQLLEARVTHPGQGKVLVSARFTATALESSVNGGSAATITLASDALSFDARGDTQTLQVNAVDADGNALAASALNWTTSDSEVARVDGNGVVTAWSDGTTTIVAGLGGVSDSATVSVARQPVAINVVSPVSAMTTGQEVQLTSRLVDSNGYPIGYPLVGPQWSTSGANADVSAEGYLRTVEAGALSVDAEYQDLSGSADISVTDPAMVGTPIFADGLESGSLSMWQGGGDATYHTVVRDPALARSGDHVLRVDYPAGSSAGYLTTLFGPGHDGVRMRFWVQLQEGWQGSTSLVGLYGSRTDDIWSGHGQHGVCPDGTNYFNSFVRVGGTSERRPLSFSTAHMGLESPCHGSSGTGESSFVSGQGLVPGQWHRVEVEVRANTPGLADGSQSVWIDGALVGQWNGLEFRAGTMLALNSAQLAFSADGQASTDQYLLIDDVEVSVTAEASTDATGVTIDQSAVAFDALGATQQLSASDGSGASLSSGSLTWTSANPGVATVDAQGMVTAAGNGSTLVTATRDGASASVGVSVQQAISAIAITPSSAAMNVGDAQSFSAISLDGNGRTVSGASIVWSSTSSSVASVDQNGRVAALAGGTATIAATANGVIGRSYVTVSGDVDDGTVTGGSTGLWPNEPAGFTVLTDQPWSELASNGWSHQNRGAYSHIVSDPTAPHSGSSVLEHVYPEGFTADGTEPAVEWINAGGTPDVFVGFWFKASEGWQGHAESGINKVFFMWGTEFRRNIVLTMRGGVDGPFRLEIQPEGHTASFAREADGLSGYLPQNVNQAELIPGRWYRIEIRVSYGTGTVEWWQDGVQLGSHTGLQLDGTGFGELQIAPTWGGRGTLTKQQDDYFRFDHFRISTGN